MKVVVDTESKTVSVLETVDLSKLFDFLKVCLGDDFKDYKLETNKVETVVKVVEKEPVYIPYYPYWQPYWKPYRLNEPYITWDYGADNTTAKVLYSPENNTAQKVNLVQGQNFFELN